MERARGPVEIAREVRVAREGRALDIAPPGGHEIVEHPRALGVEHLRQRLRHFVAPDRAAARDLAQRVAPPRQAHLRDQRLGGHPGRTGDLEIEGVERDQHCAGRHRRGHGRKKAVRVAARERLGELR